MTAHTFTKRYWLGLFSVAGLGIALATTGCSALDTTQRAMIFQPSDRIWQRADTQGMEDVWISFHSQDAQQDVRLHGLWLPHENPDAPVLLYLHGARWNVTGSTLRMRNMHSLGFAVLAIDYRGFGKTAPQELPSEASAREDALAAWQWLHTRFPQHQRWIFGHSLGGAIAVDLATRVDDEQALLVESTFTNIRDMAHNFRWGWLPVGPFITQKFDSLSKIGQVGSPVVVVHGSSDALIAPWHGEQLYAAAQQPKQWILVEGGSHHSTNSAGLPQYRAALQALAPKLKLAGQQTPGSTQ